MRTLLHFGKFLLGIDSAHTQVTDRELDILIRHASSSDFKILVEIGCFEGKTSIAIAKNTSGKVFSIDPFVGGRIGVNYGEWIARIGAKRERVKNLNLVKDFSFNAARSFHKDIDFLFIDADHSYKAIRQDWEDWSPKVKNGGIIALHDCKISVNSPTYMGSMQFYDQDIPKFTHLRQIEAIDSLVVFRVEK